MELYRIYGTFRVSIEAESENEALDKLDEMTVLDLNRVNIVDVVEF